IGLYASTRALHHQADDRSVFGTLSQPAFGASQSGVICSIPVLTFPASRRPRIAARDVAMHIMMNEFRYAARQLYNSPWVTVTVILTLALGIGANTAVFSVMNAVLLKGLPVPNPQELVY